MRIWFLLLALPCMCNAQLQLSGTVFDAANREALAFASVGIAGKPVGTVADVNGYFELHIGEDCKNDTIRISSIGYQTFAIPARILEKEPGKQLLLQSLPQQLEEVVVVSKKVKYKTLGASRYTKNNCTGFVSEGENWKGSEAAVLLKNSKNALVESFSFYVIQNKYADSLLFRLMFYRKIKNDWVGPTFLRKPIIFKLGTRSGEFTLPLRDYNIRYEGDFFVSLECLMDDMNISKFCYSGTPATPSYYKVKAFSKWHSTAGTRSGGGGADFNVRISYTD